jgi:hypothetical protein
MRIDDLPRPWLLAAMTGVPMTTLLEQAEREWAERAEVARRAEVACRRAEEARLNAAREKQRRARLPVAERPAFHLPVRLAS